MADGWRATPQNEVLAAIAKWMRDPLFTGHAQEPSFAGDISRNAGELLFGKAPDEAENLSYGSSPLTESKIPAIRSSRKQGVADLAFSIPDIGDMGKLAAGSALAGVVKPKGGSWLKTSPTVEGLKPDYPRYNPVPEIYEGLPTFQDKYADPYRKKVDKWVKNEMGTEGDPLKDVPIGETPYTWGDLGDAMVHKVSPERMEIKEGSRVKVNPDTGVEEVDPITGRFVKEPNNWAEYWNPRDEAEFSTDNQRMVEVLRNWKENPVDEHYIGLTPETAARKLVEQPREAPREHYSEPMPVFNPETSQYEFAKVGGKKFMGPIPEWNPPGSKYELLAEGVRSPLTDIGDFAGSYYQDILANNPGRREMAETFPDMLRKWPGEYNTLERGNRKKNADGTETVAEFPDLGYALVKMTTPQAVQREGKLMRHCVGQYCDEVGKTSNFYSLRKLDNMSPSVTISTRIKEAPKLMGGEADPQNIVDALRDPQRYAEDQFDDDDVAVLMGNLPAPIRDIDLMGKILQLGELMNNSRAYGEFLGRPENVDLQRAVSSYKTKQALEKFLPPEMWELVKPIFSSVGKPTESIAQVKGSANHPVVQKYQDALAEALRTMDAQGTQPGTLTSEELKYAQRVPVKREVGAGYDYPAMDEVKGKITNYIRTIPDYRTWQDEIYPNMSELLGRRVADRLDSLMYNQGDSAQISEEINNLTGQQLSALYSALSKLEK